MTKLYLLLALFAGAAYASSPFIVSNLIDQGLTASQAVVTDSNKQLASVARGTLSDAGTDGIVVTNGGSSVFGSGTSLAQHVSDTTHNGYLTSTDWNTFNSKFNLPSLTAGSVLFSNGSTIAQDNTNFFWDNTNKYLGIGQAIPVARLHIKNDADQQSGGIKLEAQSNTNAWAIWASNGNVFRLYNYGLNANLMSADGQSHFMFGTSTTNPAVIGIKHPNGITPNGDASLVIEQGAGPQTGDAVDIYNTVPTLTSKITHAGKGFFSNLRDTALGAGIVTSDPSGDFTVTGTTGTGSVVLATAPTMTNPVVGTQSTGDNSTKAASTAFVQTALAQLNPAAAVTAASTANIAGTYTNAVGGVCIADTFQVTSTAAFAPDGVTLTVGQRFLMKDQSSSFQNGVWTLTTAANVGVLGALLTRALDFDSSADLNAGSIVPVISGTVNAGSSWFQTANVTTCNSDSQTWTQFQRASSDYLLKANNLSDVANKTTSFDNIAPCSTQGDIAYYNGTHWVCLATGTSGQFLKTLGAAANPAWADVSATAPTCEVTYDSCGTHCHGTTDTNIFQYGATQRSAVGCATDLTVSTTDANGTKITVNTAGTYTIGVTFGISGATCVMGITIDDSALSTAINNPLTYAQGVRNVGTTGANSNRNFVGATLKLNVNNIIRAHDANSVGSGCSYNDSQSMITVTRIN